MDQMRELGFDETKPCGCFFIFCGGPTDHPQRYGGLVITLVVRYRVTDRWAISAGLADVDLGSATGWKADSTAFFGGTSLDSGLWSDSPVWVLAHLAPWHRIHFGLGPSLHRLRRDEDVGLPQFTSSRLGLTAEATLEVPRASRVFWMTSLRGHWIPGSSVASPSVGTVPLRTKFSYLTVQTGIGIRL